MTPENSGFLILSVSSSQSTWYNFLLKHWRSSERGLREGLGPTITQAKKSRVLPERILQRREYFNDQIMTIYLFIDLERFDNNNNNNENDDVLFGNSSILIELSEPSTSGIF